MNKKDYIDMFNGIIRGDPVPFKEKVIPMISDYLTEINYENREKMISLIEQNPLMGQNLLEELIEYYCIKFNIFRLFEVIDQRGQEIFKSILYYE